MSEFKKYPSIENHYQSKFIERFLELYPELAYQSYIITEKLHGCNIQIHITKDNIEIGKRTDWVKDDEKFNDIQNVVNQDKYMRIFKEIQERDISGEVENITLYGELVGQGIQKGVDYGKEKQIFFFDMRLNGCMLSPFYFFGHGRMYDLPIVPVVKIAQSLEQALEFNTEFDSKVLNIENNICEGVVIKPFYNNWYSVIGESFWIKKKNDKFKEIARAPKVQKEPRERTEIDDLNDKFLEYITDNRLQSIFSKYGQIQDCKQIGEYIKYLIDDAKIDFEKEYSLTIYHKDDIKRICSIGSEGFKLLKNYL